MDLKNHCLFCLERTVPYSVFSRSTAFSGGDVIGGGIIVEGREEVPADFQSLCTYLRISLPKKEKGYEGAVLSSSCDKFLCISCFEMVDQLNKLHKELIEIQRRIGEATGRIREVIVAHDIGANLSSSNKKRREAFEKKVGAMASKGKRISKDVDCLAFLEMFQTMVKSLNDAADVNNDEKESSIPTNYLTSQRNRRKKVVNDKSDTDVSNLQMEPVAMKIEVVEEELNIDYGAEGVTDSFADFPNNILDLPDGNMVGDQEIEFNTSGRGRVEARAGSENEDDTEWKPAMKKGQPKAKRKSNDQAIMLSKPRKQRRMSSGPLIKEEKLLSNFKCADCGLVFTTWKKRTEHRLKSHPRKAVTFRSVLESIPTVPSTAPPGTRGRVHIYICTVCGQHVKEDNISKLFNYRTHMLSHDEQASNTEEKRPHRCTECDKQFNLKINLDLHKTCVHDLRQEALKCDLCTDNIKHASREALIAHLKAEHDDTVHSCKHCPVSFISFEKLLLHTIKHKGFKEFSCPECVAGCKTVKELEEHCYQFHPHLKETYTCERCNKLYVSRLSFRLHMERDHGFDRKSNTFKEDLANANLTCPRCPPKGTVKIYKTALALHIHIRSYHKQSKRFKCDQCEKYFYSRGGLQKHIEYKHEKIRHPCPHCPKSYSDAYSLNHHMKTHTGEGLLTCDVCSKQFPTMMQLKSHMRVHDTTKPDPEEKRVCEDCGKEFPDQYRLMKHKQNVHPKGTKECTVCGLEFKRPDHLRSHMRTHSGERPYQCPACKKSFNRRDILRVHVKGVHGMELAEAEEKYKEDSGDG